MFLEQPPDGEFGVEKAILEVAFNEKVKSLVAESPTGYRVIKLKTKAQEGRITEFVFDIFIGEIRCETNGLQFAN